jgi:hypothetical protein
MSFALDMAMLDQDIPDVLGGEMVIYRPEAGGEHELLAIFDREYVEQGSYESEYSTRSPSIFLSGEEVAKLPIDPRDDNPVVVVRGQEYAAREVVTGGPASGDRRIHLTVIP